MLPENEDSRLCLSKERTMTDCLNHRQRMSILEKIDANVTYTQCDSSKKIVRLDRSQEPTIHYGIIASGNSVVKDSVSRDEILHRLDKCILF